VLKHIKSIQNNLQSDWLVRALGGICSGYERAGKLLYTLALPHLKMKGILLNNVQKVLISYSACLLQDKSLAETPVAAAAAAGSALDVDTMDAEAEYEQRGKELIRHLLPNLDVWLRR